MLHTSVLAGCSLLGLAGPQQNMELQSSLDVDVAAWLVADICRHEFPGADPLPQHAGAPVLRYSANHFQVYISRGIDDGYRIALNGRLTPPRIALPVEQNPQPCKLSNVDFLPAAEKCSHASGTLDEVHITIQSNGKSGCRLELQFEGEPARGKLARHISSALAAAQTVQVSADLLAAGKFSQADRRLMRQLDAWKQGCCGHHQLLTARMHLHRSVADAHRLDLHAMRQNLSAALDLDDSLDAVRFWLYQSNRRLARSLESEKILLSMGIAQPAMADCISQARAFLRDNDLHAATHWAERALSEDSSSMPAHLLIAEVHTRRGQQYKALLEELLILDQDPSNPESILRVVKRHMDMGDPTAALRALGQQWAMVQNGEPHLALKYLRQCLGQLSPKMASRLLLNSRTPSLAEHCLQDWQRTGCAGSAGYSLLSRIEQLRNDQAPRSHEIKVLNLDTPSGYDMAPGVAPPK